MVQSHSTSCNSMRSHGTSRFYSSFRLPYDGRTNAVCLWHARMTHPFCSAQQNLQELNNGSLYTRRKGMDGFFCHKAKSSRIIAAFFRFLLLDPRSAYYAWYVIHMFAIRQRAAWASSSITHINCHCQKESQRETTKEKPCTSLRRFPWFSDQPPP